MSDTKKVKCWACQGTGVRSWPGNGSPGSAGTEKCGKCDGTGMADPYVLPDPGDDVIIPAGD